MLGTSIICINASYFHEEIRRNTLLLTYELEIKNKQLASLDELKSNFFANISHELRTPLTLILAPVQELMHSGAQLPDKVTDVLALVRSNGLRLLKLVNDLLDVIRLEESKFELEQKPLDVIALVKGTVSSMAQLASMQDLVLHDDLPDQSYVVLGNHAALEKVFFNLLNNAVKFTPQGGTIHVSAQCDEQSIRLMVRDTGVGIQADAMPTIFDKFRQGDNSATRKHQGTGLGLALVKELVDKHDGQVEVHSQPGQGTEMVIVLPLLPNQNMALAGDSHSADDVPDHVAEDDHLSQLYRAAEQGGGLAQSLPAHIEALDMLPLDENAPVQLVLADDEPEMRRYIGTLLSQHWHTRQTDNGQSAWELIAQHQPALAVLDVMMPGIDGLRLCQKIKNNPATARTKVLLLTARADEAAKLEALRYGADDFLTKPFSTLELQTRLKNLFENYQLNQNLWSSNSELKQTLGQLRQTQQELIHSEKINSLGIMAAGLLHEVNNPVNFMLMALANIKRRQLVPPEGKLHDTLVDVQDGVQRISRIVSDLRTFAYPSEAEQKQAFHAREAVDSALRFTAHERAGLQGLTVAIEQVEDDMAIGSQTHIVQVLINLLTNAYKAIDALAGARPGHIQMGIAKGTVPRDDFLCITVQDNGEGIAPEKLQQVFDPFFTTSAPGQGTGLGLSICHTILKNHGGAIHVRSTLGEGTVFTLELPRQ
jgi:signal transduction histidine kinase